MKKSSYKSLVSIGLLASLLSTHAFAFDVQDLFKSYLKVSEESRIRNLKEQQAKETRKKEVEKEIQRRTLHTFPKSRVEFNLKPVTNSLVYIKGATPPDIKKILVRVNKAGTEFNDKNNFEVILTERDYYDTVVPLTQRGGKYTIEIYAKKENAPHYSYLITYYVDNYDDRDNSFLLPTTMVQSEHPEIKELSQRITAGASSKKEAVTLIHQYVISFVKYNMEGYKDKSYLKEPYDALHVSKKLVAVCAGYSNFFAALVRAAGIKAKVVNGLVVLSPGVSEEHAWNEVLVDDKWEIIDTTWSVDRNDDKYFFADPKVFAEDHTKTKEMPY